MIKPAVTRADDIIGTRSVRVLPRRSLEETLRRHAMRPRATEFTVQDMRDWYHPRDLVGFTVEHVVPETSTMDATTASIAAVSDLPLTARGEDFLPALARPVTQP